MRTKLTLVNHPHATFGRQAGHQTGRAMGLAGAFLLLSACGGGSAPTATVTRSFQEDCYRAHFPMALGIPAQSIPKEVQFYCSTSWNLSTLESVQAAVDKHDFDVLGALVRSVPENEQQTLEWALAQASRGATLGPKDMPLVWKMRIQLPVLYSLRPGAVPEQTSAVHEHFVASDIEKARRAAAEIDWSLPAEQDPPPHGGKVRSLALIAGQIPTM